MCDALKDTDSRYQYAKSLMDKDGCTSASE